MGKRCCKEGLGGASNWATAGLTRRDLSIGPVFWSGKGGGVAWRRVGRGYAVAPGLPYWPDFVGRFRGFVLAIWAL